MGYPVLAIFPKSCTVGVPGLRAHQEEARLLRLRAPGHRLFSRVPFFGHFPQKYYSGMNTRYETPSNNKLIARCFFVVCRASPPGMRRRMPGRSVASLMTDTALSSRNRTPRTSGCTARGSARCRLFATMLRRYGVGIGIMGSPRLAPKTSPRLAAGHATNRPVEARLSVRLSSR